MRLVILDSFFDDPGYQERQEGFSDGEEKAVTARPGVNQGGYCRLGSFL